MKRSRSLAVVGLVLVVAMLFWYLLGAREGAAPGRDSASGMGARSVPGDRLSPREPATGHAPAGSLQIGVSLPAAAASESELAFQVAELNAAVTRLEAAIDRLDMRITRSRLAVPAPEERAAQLVRAEARLQNLRTLAAAKRDRARTLARAKGIELDAKQVLTGILPQVLEQDAEFVSARDNALAEDRVVAAFEKQLAELRFSTVIDALPSE